MGNTRHRRRRRTARRNRGCATKTAYPTERAALNASVRLGHTWYRCRYCPAWHTTSSKG